MTVQNSKQGHHLLAVDLGLKSGMAMFGPDGRLLWYRSQHFAGPAQLRRAAARTLGDARLGWLISEGDVTLGAIWERIAMRHGIRVQRVNASTWRDALLAPRPGDQEAAVRRQAQALARQVIAQSGAPVPAALEDDAAAAILIGLWGVMRMGWLRELPAAVGAAPSARPVGRRAANS